MHWKTIGVLGKPAFALESLETFNELHALFAAWQTTAFFENEVGHLLHLDAALCFDARELTQKCDLILVVGGDGSMLKAAKLAVEFNKPLLGVNRGHLGFLTDIGPKELSQRLKAVLDGSFWIEKRLILEGDIIDSQKNRHHHIALNDVVLSLGASTHLIEFDLWVDEQFVCRQRADGMIIATPTGSTAYALSAGGPILHPQLNAFALVPMLPHKLTSRPLVINSNACIKIILQNSRDIAALVSFDSQQQYTIDGQTTIELKQYAQALQLVHPNDYDYFQTLRNKLSWESR